jgi:hypothetical protein
MGTLERISSLGEEEGATYVDWVGLSGGGVGPGGGVGGGVGVLPPLLMYLLMSDLSAFNWLLVNLPLESPLLRLEMTFLRISRLISLSSPRAFLIKALIFERLPSFLTFLRSVWNFFDLISRATGPVFFPPASSAGAAVAFGVMGRVAQRVERATTA